MKEKKTSHSTTSFPLTPPPEHMELGLIKTEFFKKILYFLKKTKK